MWSWITKRDVPDRNVLGGADEHERRAWPRRPCYQKVNLVWRDPRGIERSLEATIDNASRSGVGLRVSNEFEAGQMVMLGQQDAQLQRAVVRYCLPESASVWRVGAKLVETEKRRIDRSEASGACEIRWSGDRGSGMVVSGSVENISEFGAQVRTTEAIPVNTVVRMSGESSDCIGAVRYCVTRGEGYLLGLHFIGDPGMD